MLVALLQRELGSERIREKILLSTYIATWTKPANKSGAWIL